MALVKAETAQGFQSLPAFRQIGLMMGLAASVALGVAVVLWSQNPNYTVLYANLGSKDAGQVVDALQKSGIQFKVDEATGAVMVESGKLQHARMELAKDGLPEGNAMGFELLEKEQGFGTSQFIETARFQRALEGELGRTIATLRNVDTARVHLAIPKRSVFLRDRSEPTASVMVDLYSGRSLDEEQVAAIVHLVSSSVPHLKPENVTVVDQGGKLLSNGAADKGMAQTSTQFAYNRKLETTYAERIRQLLEPIVGAGRVRASVNAELDFTVTERTQESFNPDLPALRSEQVSEDHSARSDVASGVPGALSNQPPEGAQLQQPGDPAARDNAASGVPQNSSKRSVRNYELDKTVSHTKLASGTVRRLSIAVVIDNKQALDANDEPLGKPWTAEDLERFTTLTKEAVGFNAARGDTLNIINSSFVPPPAGGGRAGTFAHGTAVGMGCRQAGGRRPRGTDSDLRCAETDHAQPGGEGHTRHRADKRDGACGCNGRRARRRRGWRPTQPFRRQSRSRPNWRVPAQATSRIWIRRKASSGKIPNAWRRWSRTG